LEVFTVILILLAKLSPKELCMITRKSFFIRWLLVRDEEEQLEEKSVIDVEHIQSGNKRRLSNLEEASLWMLEIDAESAEKSRKIERE